MLPTHSTWKSSVNMHVPDAHYSSDLGIDNSIWMDLGAPVTADADGILNDESVASAGSTSTFETTYSNSVMGRYGRNVTAVCSGANTDALVIRGRDYLGQPMSETLTLAGTATVAGKKAFAVVEEVEWLAQAGETIDVGWGDVLGLPFKTREIELVLEDNEPYGASTGEASVTVTGMDSAGTGVATFTAPFDGYIRGWEGWHTTAMTGAPSVLDAVVAGTGQSTLDGVAPIAVAGLKFGVNLAVGSWIAVNKGDTFTLTSDGAGTGGVSSFTAFFSRGLGTFAAAVDTDPQTATTGDPRGTYDPQLACNGTRTFKVKGSIDRSDIYGVAHFYE